VVPGYCAFFCQPSPTPARPRSAWSVHMVRPHGRSALLGPHGPVHMVRSTWSVHMVGPHGPSTWSVHMERSSNPLFPRLFRPRSTWSTQLPTTYSSSYALTGCHKRQPHPNLLILKFMWTYVDRPIKTVFFVWTFLTTMWTLRGPK
jgi:hypothetical protein